MLWAEQENYIFNDLDKADNEFISNDGFTYTRGVKPTESHINDLRHIKRTRRVNKYSDVIAPLHPLKDELLKIVGMRKEARQECLKNIALNLIKMYKERNAIRITNEDINDLVKFISNKDSRAKIRKALISFLMSKGLIEKDVFRKSYYSFIRKPLLTYEKYINGKLVKVDCGSNVSIGRIKQTHKVIVYNIL